jgi:hypothetical protein
MFNEVCPSKLKYEPLRRRGQFSIMLGRSVVVMV